MLEKYTYIYSNLLLKKSKILLIFVLLSLTSCVETIVVSTGVGAGLAYREKTIEDTRSDIKIATKIGLKFISNGLKNPGNTIDITVNEGRVMLTGIARDSSKAKLAQDLCWQIKGVNEVIDEIQIRNNEGLKIIDFPKALYDYLITAEVEGKFALAKDLRALNFQITTVNKKVYLLGVAINDKEMNRAIAIASKVRGVEEVVNHIILANDSRRGG